MPHRFDTDSLAFDQRLDELAEILADGLMRLEARKSSQKAADLGETPLDIRLERSGHPAVYEQDIR